MYNKITRFTTTLLVAFLLVPLVSQAQLSSPNYQVDVFGVGTAGAGTATSTNYTSESNIGPDFEYNAPVTQTTSGGGGGGGSSNNDDDETESESVLETEADGAIPLTENDSLNDDVDNSAAPTTIFDVVEDRESDTDDSDLILGERSFPYTDNGDYITVTEDFDDGSIVTMGVHSNAILDENGNQVTDDKELRIILRVRLLATEMVPVKSLQSDLQGGKLFELLVVDQFGTKYTTFDPALDVSITLPPDTIEAEEVRLYFLDEETQDWIQITTAEFVEDAVSFSVNHLTTFGVWGVSGNPEILKTEAVFPGDTDGSRYPNSLTYYWWVLLIIGVLIAGVWKYHSHLKRKI